MLIATDVFGPNGFPEAKGLIPELPGALGGERAYV
jgi:hypothetical protein